MKRFETTAIYNRLNRVGYIHKPDVTWIEKRKAYLLADWREGYQSHEAQLELNKIDYIEKRIFLPCEGEAHRNAFIDHCGMCMPRRGVVINSSTVCPSFSKNR